MIGPPVVAVDELAVHFRPRRRGSPVARAVDGLSLQLRRGEVVVLVGESGCGKTTLARSLLGLVPPTSGTISIDGMPLADRSTVRAARRRTGLVPQDPMGALNPRRTVLQSVCEGLEIHRVDGDHRALAMGAMARCGLRPAERFADLFPHQLSGGQRQRVVIAGAMVLAPSLLIADEPVSALDASVRGEVLALLLDLARNEAVTMLVITHDLGLAWNIADRVAVMYLGRIVEEGPAEQVLLRPQHPYTEALLAARPEAGGGDSPLGGEPPDPTRVPEGCRFNPRCPTLLGGLAEQAGVAALCVTNEPTLRDADGGAQCACWVTAPG
jgi:oligopeptide/dipeptide ABC transporter ATP-binding protein